MIRLRLPVIILFLIFCTLTLAAKDYKASLFGVRSDGKTLNTGSIQKAVDYISENGGGCLVFYVGRYLTGSIQLKSDVSIRLEEGAVLVGASEIYHYDTVGEVKSLLCAENQENIRIFGKGVIEGQGSVVTEHIEDQMGKAYLDKPDRPALIAFSGCKQVFIGEINLLDACGDVLDLRVCSGVSVEGVTLKSRQTGNSPGIVFSGCRDIKISHAYIDTSGMEISSDKTSIDVAITDTKNRSGKMLSE